jgi:DNA polymerase III delta prime subunit
MMHHAQLFVGGEDWARTMLPEFFGANHVDVHHLQYDRMLIDDARALLHHANLRPQVLTKKTFVLRCTTILPEAQNALLKLFEEPLHDTEFILILPNLDALLTTLRSRLHLVAVEQKNIDTAPFESFCKEQYTDRLTIIQKKLDAEDVRWVQEIVQGALTHARATRNTELMTLMLYIESNIMYTGSSKKMLLEHLALSI